MRPLPLAILLCLAVDSPDVQTWRSCQTRSGISTRNEACKPFDLDHDGDVDQDDFGAWQRQVASAPTACPPCPECPCDPTVEHGAQITCQIWKALPPDLQAEWDEFNVQFGKKLATRPAER